MIVSPVLRREWLQYRHAMGRAGLIRFIVIYGLVFGFFIPGQFNNPSAAFLVFAIIPLYVAGPVAVDGFVGERERNTFETLISSPVLPKELLSGKIIFSVLLGVAISWTTMSLFLLFRLISGGALPEFPGIPFIILFGITMSFLGTLTGLHVSVRARSVRSAMQWFSVVLLVVTLGIPVGLQLILPRLPEGIMSFTGRLFSTGWFSPGTAIILGVLSSTLFVLYITLRRRTRRLWKLNRT
jgi:ABC-type Na+ efflux pump permease subunit